MALAPAMFRSLVRAARFREAQGASPLSTRRGNVEAGRCIKFFPPVNCTDRWLFYEQALDMIDSKIQSIPGLESPTTRPMIELVDLSK